jgi:hypothetical protein
MKIKNRLPAMLHNYHMGKIDGYVVKDYWVTAPLIFKPVLGGNNDPDEIESDYK